jgi:hypothetical protein
MVMSKWPTRLKGGAMVWQGMVASVGMAVVGMEAVVAAIADGINRDRHRSLSKCRRARPFRALPPGRWFSRRPIS